MIIGFIGSMRSGKTLLMTAHAYDLYKQGYKVISNYGVSFKHKPLSVKDIEESIKDKDTDYFENTVVLLDEVGVYIDSRTSATRRNRLYSYFLTQSGKLSTTIFWTSQYFGQIDKRLRQNTQIVYSCQRTDYKGTPLRQDDKRKDFRITADKMVQREMYDRVAFVQESTLTIDNPKVFFRLFDTKERVYYDE